MEAVDGTGADDFAARLLGLSAAAAGVQAGEVPADSPVEEPAGSNSTDGISIGGGAQLLSTYSELPAPAARVLCWARASPDPAQRCVSARLSLRATGKQALAGCRPAPVRCSHAVLTS